MSLETSKKVSNSHAEQGLFEARIFGPDKNEPTSNPTLMTARKLFLVNSWQRRLSLEFQMLPICKTELFLQGDRSPPR